MKRLVLSALSLLLALPAQAGMRARYGGELRVATPAMPSTFDPSQIATPTDLAVARLVYGTLFTLGTDGSLSPELATAVPEAEAGGRLFRIKLRPGIHFHDGAALTAQDVAASLARLLDPSNASPFSVIALPIVGAADSAHVPAGLAVSSETDLQVSLAFSYPDWPRALAHPASAPLSGGKIHAKPVGTGPFLFSGSPEQGRLAAFVDCPAGRPFVDALRLTAADARTSARALSLGEVDAALGSTEKRAAEGPALFATYLALNSSRLGADAAAVRQVVESSVDVADLARFFARGALPMTSLLATGLEPVAPPAARPPSHPSSLPANLQLTLLLDASADDQRIVGERLQIKLHDVGASVQLKRVPHAEYRQALTQGSYDLALVSFAALPEPGLALAQLVQFAQGRDAARELLRTIGSGTDPAARHALLVAQAAAMRSRLPLLPLYAQSPRLAVRASVAAVGFDGCGAPALADAWFIEPRP